MTPDFSKYTYFELLDALNSIDREKHPERVKEINEELINIVEKMENVGFRLPFHGIPAVEFIKEELPKGLWHKIKSVFNFSDKPLKVYGNIDASISEGESGRYNLTSVAAYMIEDKGFLNLVLRGQFYDNSREVHEEARIKINASNIARLKEMLTLAEADIKAKNLTSGR
jgi:hypothetical protein